MQLRGLLRAALLILQNFGGDDPDAVYLGRQLFVGHLVVYLADLVQDGVLRVPIRLSLLRLLRLLRLGRGLGLRLVLQPAAQDKAVPAIVQIAAGEQPHVQHVLQIGAHLVFGAARGRGQGGDGHALLLPQHGQIAAEAPGPALAADAVHQQAQTHRQYAQNGQLGQQVVQEPGKLPVDEPIHHVPHGGGQGDHRDHRQAAPQQGELLALFRQLGDLLADLGRGGGGLRLAAPSGGGPGPQGGPGHRLGGIALSTLFPPLAAGEAPAPQQLQHDQQHPQGSKKDEHQNREYPGAQLLLRLLIHVHGPTSKPGKVRQETL